jgi:hypothetical protein
MLREHCSCIDHFSPGQLDCCKLQFIIAVSLTLQLRKNVQWLDDWHNAGTLGEWSIKFVSAALPSSVSALFSYFLPILMRRLSKFSGAASRGELDKDVITQYFAFQMFSQFFVFSILGILYSEW